MTDMATQVVRAPTIFIRSIVLDKIMAYTHSTDGEFTIMAYVRRDWKNPGDFIIEELQELLEQEATGGHCIFTDASDVRSQQLAEETGNPAQMRGWVHSHVNMDVFWSGTDNAMVDRYVKNIPWLVSVVVNKKGALLGRIDIADPVRLTFNHVKIVRLLDDELMAVARREVASKIHLPLAGAVLEHIPWTEWEAFFGEKGMTPEEAAQLEESLRLVNLAASDLGEPLDSGPQSLPTAADFEMPESYPTQVPLKKLTIGFESGSPNKPIHRYITLASVNSKKIYATEKPAAWLKDRLSKAKINAEIELIDLLQTERIKMLGIPPAAILFAYQSAEMLESKWWGTERPPPWEGFVTVKEPTQSKKVNGDLSPTTALPQLPEPQAQDNHPWLKQQ